MSESRIERQKKERAIKNTDPLGGKCKVTVPLNGMRKAPLLRDIRTFRGRAQAERYRDNRDKKYCRGICENAFKSEAQDHANSQEYKQADAFKKFVQRNLLNGNKIHNVTRYEEKARSKSSRHSIWFSTEDDTLYLNCQRKGVEKTSGCCLFGGKVTPYPVNKVALRDLKFSEIRIKKTGYVSLESHGFG